MVRILVFLGLIAFASGQDWQQNVEANLIARGLQQGAILGSDGSEKAASEGFSLNDGEPEALISLFENPEEGFEKGVRINGILYLVTKTDSGTIIAKKGKGGVVLVKTEQNIIVGVFDHSLQSSVATLILEQLGENFRGNGY